LVAATLSAVGVPDADAGVSIELGLTEISHRSTAVVVGTATESRSMWEQAEGRSRIVTYHRVSIDRVAAGAIDGTETWVRTLGGRVGDIGQRVEGEAVLTQSKRMLLFLASRPDGGSRVVGMAQGAWLIVRGTDGVERVRPGLQRGMLVPNRDRKSATAELSGHSIDEAVARVAAARASHAP
jgi:hypothetical protein